MTRIKALKEAIEALPEVEYVRLRQWFAEKDWLSWDNQIKKDSAQGKLDFLVKEAFDQKNKGKLRDL
jgi:hypothetical protein